MERTAEEFVHKLPDGRWFVGDFVKTDSEGHEVFLVEPYRSGQGVELRIAVIARTGRAYISSRTSAVRSARRSG